MDMPPNFERLYGIEQRPRRFGMIAVACLLGVAVGLSLLGLKLALGPNFALLDATGAVFGP